jgi:transposase
MSPQEYSDVRGQEADGMEYSKELRAKVVERALARTDTQEVLAKEFGIGRSTIQNWVRQYRASGENPLAGGEKRPQAWTREERLDALLTTHGLSEEELGRWCRQHGVHTHHLLQWRRELIEGGGEQSKASKEARSLREENRGLKKELRRKEKALAETTALLVLKKKAVSIWGEPEDD